MKVFLNFKKSPLFYLICGVLILCVGFVLYTIFRTPVVAVYGLSERQYNALVNLSVFKDENGKQKFNFVKFDENLSLQEQFDNTSADLLVAYESAELEKIAQDLFDSTSSRLGIEQKLLGNYTTVARSQAGISKAANAVKIPIANDFLSFAYDYSFASDLKQKEFASLKEIENYLVRCKSYVDNPIVFAGGTTNFVLDLVGLFCENLSGVEQYKNAVKMCLEYEKSGNKNALELAKRLCDDKETSPLYESVQKLKSWYKNGYFTKNVFSMNYEDVFYHMKNNKAPVVLLTLSARRNVGKETVGRYVSFYSPTDRKGARAFISPMVCVLCLSKNSSIKDAAYKLTLERSQESFSFESGLAPLASSCKTADRQADDVRYWTAIAATSLAGFSKECFIDKQLANEVCEIIKNMITN